METYDLRRMQIDLIPVSSESVPRDDCNVFAYNSAGFLGIVYYSNGKWFESRTKKEVHTEQTKIKWYDFSPQRIYMTHWVLITNESE